MAEAKHRDAKLNKKQPLQAVSGSNNSKMANRTLKQKAYELFYYCKAESLSQAVVLLSSSQSRWVPLTGGEVCVMGFHIQKHASSAKVVQNYLWSLVLLFILVVFKPALNWLN